MPGSSSGAESRLAGWPREIPPRLRWSGPRLRAAAPSAGESRYSCGRRPPPGARPATQARTGSGGTAFARSRGRRRARWVGVRKPCETASRRFHSRPGRHEPLPAPSRRRRTGAVSAHWFPSRGRLRPSRLGRTNGSPRDIAHGRPARPLTVPETTERAGGTGFGGAAAAHTAGLQKTPKAYTNWSFVPDIQMIQLSP
jgi:hypothetical protein